MRPRTPHGPPGLRQRLVLAALAGLALSGCTSMSGLDGGSNYACKAPDGVTCESVSGTYANAVQNRLPGQRRPASAADESAPPPRPPTAARAAEAATAGAAREEPPRPAQGPTGTVAAPPAMPLRSAARILRLWVKPWEDADGDLHDQGHVYVQIDGGRWLVEHAQRRIREAYAPLRPPPGGPAAAAAAGTREAAAPAWPPGPQTFPGAAAPVPRPSDGR